MKITWVTEPIKDFATGDSPETANTDNLSRAFHCTCFCAPILPPY